MAMMDGLRKKNALKSLAREISRRLSILDRTSSTEPAAGLVKTWSGLFWDEAIANELVQLRRDAVEFSEDIDSKASAMYALAGLLWQLLRLPEAALACEELIRIDARKKIPALNILAHVEARQGRIDKAREIAKEIADVSNGGSYLVSDGTLTEQYEAWRQLGK